MKKALLIVSFGVFSTLYGDSLGYLAQNYSKNIDISKDISSLKQKQQVLNKVIKDKELKNLLKFISIRLKELENLKSLPATKERVKRVSDISKELNEAQEYIQKRMKKDKTNLASL